MQRSLWARSCGPGAIAFRIGGMVKIVWPTVAPHSVTWRQNREALKRSPITTWAPTMSRSEEHTSELQSLMRNSYAVFCLKKKTCYNPQPTHEILTREHNRHSI